MDAQELKDLDRLYSAIGFIAVRWAMMEQSLDFCISIIYRDCGGNTLTKEIPRSMSNKIPFLRKAFRTIPSLLERQEWALNIFDRITAIKELREGVIHAALNDTKHIDGKFFFTKIKYSSHQHYEEEFVFDVRNFPAQSTEFLDLAMLVTALGMWLQENHRPQPQAPQQPHQSKSRAPQTG